MLGQKVVIHSMLMLHCGRPGYCQGQAVCPHPAQGGLFVSPAPPLPSLPPGALTTTLFRFVRMEREREEVHRRRRREQGEQGRR